jgi:hypothetical protein
VSTHIIDIYENLIEMVELIVLEGTQYCYILDPFDEEK